MTSPLTRPTYSARITGVSSVELYVDFSAYASVGIDAPLEWGGVCRGSLSQIVNIVGGGGVLPLLTEEVDNVESSPAVRFGKVEPRQRRHPVPLSLSDCPGGSMGPATHRSARRSMKLRQPQYCVQWPESDRWKSARRAFSGRDAFT